MTDRLIDRRIDADPARPRYLLEYKQLLTHAGLFAGVPNTTVAATPTTTVAAISAVTIPTAAAANNHALQR